jgi:hypothetical protein
MAERTFPALALALSALLALLAGFVVPERSGSVVLWAFAAFCLVCALVLATEED